MRENDSADEASHQALDSSLDEKPRTVAFFYGGFARFLSFTLAIVLAGVAMVVPQLIAEEAHEVNHSLLMLSMLGISGGFIHGVGFIPKHWFWWGLFSPFVAWPILILSMYWWFL